MFAAIEHKYVDFAQTLKDWDLFEVCSLKPLLDGKALAKALDTAPGPWMKDALDVVMAWQLRHPDATDPKLAIEEVRERRGELCSALAHHFLRLTIRPLFSKAKPDTITNEGRKVMTSALPSKITAGSLDDSVNRPWKAEREHHVLGLLRWSTSTLDSATTERFWPLVIPPTLALVDDWEIKYKILGVQCLGQVLAVTSSSMLQRTGLGDVFDQALIPCLTYLPSLTPEDDSIRLLNNVYPTILQLYRVRYPGELSTSEPSRGRAKALDNLLRKGVLYTYENCSDRPNILSVSFQHLCKLLDCLGIDAVRHLRALTTMLTETLTRQVLATHADHHAVLSMAAQAYRSVIQNAWPRISEYRGEIMKGLAKCWIALADQTANDVRHELKLTVKLLRNAVDNSLIEGQFNEECQGLARSDDRIGELLK